MELSIKSFILLGAIAMTGLSAGLFYAWSVSVIPGTQNVEDLTYLQTMQSINRAILNPAFFIVFFGSAVLLSLASVFEFQESKWLFGFFLAATICYLGGTVGVTGLGNVRLNNQLDALDLSTMNSEKLKGFRTFYEQAWNKLHTVRTVFAIVAFLLAILGLLGQIKS